VELFIGVLFDTLEEAHADKLLEESPKVVLTDFGSLESAEDVVLEA
jgi:hypothetical protein